MDDNISKSIHGSMGKMTLQQLIESLKMKGYISDYQSPIRTGYKGYNNDQFYFQFLILFDDGEKWIVHSTTSIRTDRINIQQWNAFHIKRIKHKITKSIIVYPDDISEKERNNAVNYYKKILNKDIFSAIDDVISQNEFYKMVEEKNLRDKKTGQKKAFQGINFEEQIVLILNSDSNFSKWANNNNFETGLFYPYYKQILDKLDITNPNGIREIKATRDIDKLPSGGNPKTDVILKVTYNNGKESIYTFSCKRTSSKWVTVHEYSVEKFIEVLKIADDRLKEALRHFQKVGSLRALNNIHKKCLETEMPKYNKSLALWVYGGVGGEGNPKTQWANYIITFQNETSEFKVHKLDDYVDIILKNNSGHFGTPFRWTYPSSGKGRKIQLKGRIV